MDKKSVYAVFFFSGMICTVTCITTASPETTVLTNISMTTMNQISQDNESSIAPEYTKKPSNSGGNNNATEPQNTTLTTQNLRSRPPALPTSDTETTNMTDDMTTHALQNGSSSTAAGTTTSVTAQTRATTTAKSSSGAMTTAKPRSGHLTTGLIILFIFIALVLILALYCWLQHRKRERNSFNLHHPSPDNADIPLSSDTLEKKTAENLREDKVDIHNIEPPSETSAAGDSPKQGQSSDAADAPEDDLNSTASTVPKDDEPERLSLDSSRVAFLPSGTGNLKTQETDQGEDGSGGPPGGSSVESPSEKPNENNNNNSKWTIHHLKTDEREPFMRGEQEENEGRCSAGASQADIVKPRSFSDTSLNSEPCDAGDRLLGAKE